MKINCRVGGWMGFDKPNSSCEEGRCFLSQTGGREK